MVINDRNGSLIGAVQVQESDEIMLISDQGTLVRTRVSEVSTLGRNTQGVTLIKVQEGEKLVGVAPILDADDDELVIEGASVITGEETSTSNDVVIDPSDNVEGETEE